jgi:hypothetical protein
MKTRLALLAAALVAGAVSLHAQAWQTVNVERASLPVPQLSVIVRHDVGQLNIRPTRDSVRYRASLRYDPRAVEPIYRYANDSAALRIGTRERGDKSSDGRRSSNLDLTLGSTGTLALDVRSGAAEALLDMSGLPLTSLLVSSGASDTRVRFDRPNPVRMKNLTLSTGAASIVADQLGNANAEEIVVRSAVGEIQLDLSGAWQNDTEVRAEVTLGTLTIRVPRDLGVHVETSRVLAGLSHEGFERSGSAYVTENWETATRKVRIYAQTVVGYLTIQRR